MSKLYITADWHFCHDKPFIYEDRGFSSVDEMNEEIVKRHNEVVGRNDLVYFLGDTMLNDSEGGLEYIKRLNGYFYWIWGNHDTENKKRMILEGVKNSEEVGDTIKITYNKVNLYLSHYPTETLNPRDLGLKQLVYNIHGHTHKKEKVKQDPNRLSLQYNVCLDAHDLYPVCIDDITAEIIEAYDESKLNEKEEEQE